MSKFNFIKQFALCSIVALFSSYEIGCGFGMNSKEDRLVQAVRRDDVKAIAKLLREGANINGQERHMLSETPLVACSATDATNAFFFLLSNGAGVNVPAHDGVTPLAQAVTLGDYNLVKVRELVRRGANVNAVDNHGNSILRLAKAAGANLLVDELNSAGARGGLIIEK